MASVGVVASLLHVAILIVIHMTDYVRDSTIRYWVSSGLLTKKKGPLVLPVDFWFPRMPLSLVRFRKFPLVWFTALISFLLLLSENVVELGIKQSQQCSPDERPALVSDSDASQRHENQSDLRKMAALVLPVLSTTFPTGDLKVLPDGFPRNVTEDLCVQCLDDTYPVLRNCQVEEHRAPYEAGTLDVVLQTKKSHAFGTLTKAFKSENVSFEGEGDFTMRTVLGEGENASSSCAAYVFSSLATATSTSPKTSGKKSECNSFGYNSLSFLYMEYSVSNETLCKDMIDKSKERAEQGVACLGTKGPVFSQNILCDIRNDTSFSKHSILEALAVYRSVQLENVIVQMKRIESEKRFPKIKADDIYRAVLVLMTAQGAFKNGTAKYYTKCGAYTFSFVIPLFTTTLALLAFRLVSHAAYSNAREESGFDQELTYEVRVSRGLVYRSNEASEPRVRPLLRELEIGEN